MQDDKNNMFNINSYNQSGGITAGVVNLGTHPRKVDDQSGKQLLENLQKEKKIVITSVMGDQEAFNFGHQILNFLKEKGYNAEGVNQAIYSKPIIGQFIENQKVEQTDIIIGNQERR